MVDCHAVGKLVSAVRRSKCSLCVAPASLYEAAACQSPEVRERLLSAICLPNWHRLMPEAFGEAEEIKVEVRRCRPEWLRVKPNLEEWKALRYDWKRHHGGAWDRVKRKPEMIRNSQIPTLDRARELARTRRHEAIAWPNKFKNAPLTSIRIGSSPDSAVEGWRWSGFLSFRDVMAQKGHPYVEWLYGEIDFEMLKHQTSSLRRLWLYDICINNMRRHWLRWAFEFLQQMHTVTDGTPVDCQTGTYLVEVDSFLSADRILVAIAERCRSEAPFPMARSVRVSGGRIGVEEVLDMIMASDATPKD